MTILTVTALVIALIAVGMAWVAHLKARDLRERISQTNSRIYKLRIEAQEQQDSYDKQLTQLKFQVMKLQGNLQVTPEMKIGDVLAVHPQAQQVLAGFHIGGCSSCSVDDRQSLGEAVALNGRELEPVLAALNTLVSDTNGSHDVVKTPNIQLHL